MFGELVRRDMIYLFSKVELDEYYTWIFLELILYCFIIRLCIANDVMMIMIIVYCVL